MTDTREMREHAAAKLSEQANRFMRAAQSLTKTALRIATIEQPTKVLQALAKYRQADLPEPELVLEVAAMIEGAQSPEWREARTKQRRWNDRRRLERNLSGAELPVDGLPTRGLPGWAPEIVLRIAREKCDVLSAAVLAIETGRDGNGDIMHSLADYMTGQGGVHMLRHWLEQAGVALGQSNVVPLFGRGARP